MIPFFRTVFGRISAAYLILLLIFCIVSISVAIHTATRYTQESDQVLNRALSRYLARRIGPTLEDSLNLAPVEAAMHDLMAQNPRVEIYLLDENGRILAFAADDSDLKWDRVNVAPVKAYLDGQRDLPIVGTDPRSVEEEKVFSAFPVNLAGQPGFIYIILRGQQYDSVASMVKDSYILRAAGLILLMVFALAAVAGVLAFGLTTKRIQNIVSATRAFKEGDLDQRLAPDGKDQLAQIEEAFNEMASTIQANVAALIEREDQRREFVANISHDLRSPLTSIRGYLETTIIKNETLSAEERAEYLQIVLKETALLDKLIGQLLELSKLESTVAHPKPEPFLVCELVQDVLTHFKPIASQLEVTLESPLTYDLPMVKADIGMVERVLFNLIDNALRHTPGGERIEVNGAASKDRVHLYVKDTGYGISPDDLARVTERFYKGKDGRARSSGNTGLGLAIAKKILELHGSDLVIDSTVNVGTTVSFDLAIEAPE